MRFRIQQNNIPARLCQAWCIIQACTARLARGATTRGVALSIWRSSEHRQLVSQHEGPEISFRQAYHDAMKASKDVRMKKAEGKRDITE
jgi:hypothetical protein